MHYAELHCKTNFSFLEGAAHPEELVARAVELGYSALAVTDRASLTGVVRAHTAAKEGGLRLIIGAELHPTNAPPVVLWATDRAAYGRLSRLITVGRRRAPKGECELSLDDIAEHAEGLLAGVLWEGRRTKDEVTRGRKLPAIHSPWSLVSYADIFADRCYLLASLHMGPNDAQKLDELRHVAREHRLPLVAAGDVRYHVPRRKALDDVLVAIRHGTTVDRAGDLLDPNAQRHLKPIEDLARLFADAPEALARTTEVADRCTFSLDELRYEYPSELALLDQTADDGWLPSEGPSKGRSSTDSSFVLRPSSFSPSPLFACLERLTARGAVARYPHGIPQKVRQQLEHELKLIAQLEYEAYFLTVWDLVRFARSRNILCQGRGSAANSAVCYCLGVTSVDPAQMDLLFERFVSHERDEAPDIDIDFEHERREEVLQYLYDKYGRDRAGMTAEVITYRPRSAVRDVGKALGLSLDRVDVLAKNLEGYSREPDLPKRCRMSGIDPDSPTGARLVQLVDELVGFPRHLSQHVGGMVITERPLSELVPIENAAMDARTVIAWNKDDLDELGILKVDCLALGMLTAIRKCFTMIERSEARPSPLSIASIPPDDPAVYDMICRADTVGVFQIESRAQMSMLPRLRPRCFYDLVIEVAIVRPGPIQGDMVHPYLRRRNGEEAPFYPNDAIRQVLEKTLGVPLFQEQAMRLAVVAAGFTPGEADQLRRAMGAWRRPGVIDQFRQKLMAGMRANGLSEQFAEHVFTQIRGFGEYGFPESHAASFALLVYVSAWLKCHYPVAFTAALINSQPMGFYAPAQLVRDLREHGGEVRPVDVNHSTWDCQLEGQENDGSSFALRLGFRMLVGCSAAFAERIAAERAARGPFHSLADFTRRTGASRAVLQQLSQADAFGSLGRDRRAALWDALGQGDREPDMPLLDQLTDNDEPPPPLPQLTLQQQVFADYRTAGLSLRAHPLSFYRTELNQLGVVPAEQLRQWQHNQPVCVAGLVLMRQRPSTAKGITFLTLEDETGIANLVVRVEVWERYYPIARRASAMIANGILERKGDVIHVVVRRLRDLSAELQSLRTRSRDFR